MHRINTLTGTIFAANNSDQKLLEVCPVSMIDSFSAGIEKAPADAIFKTKTMFKADQHPKKMNLGVGVYRTDEGVPYVLKAVREAEKEIALDER